MDRPTWTDFGFGSESDYETTYRQWQRDRDEGVTSHSHFSGGLPSDDDELYDEFDEDDDEW